MYFVFQNGELPVQQPKCSSTFGGVRSYFHKRYVKGTLSVIQRIKVLGGFSGNLESSLRLLKNS